MILNFELPEKCHVIRDSEAPAIPSPLHFWAELRQAAEAKCHVIRDTFAGGALVQRHERDFDGVPPDAA